MNVSGESYTNRRKFPEAFSSYAHHLSHEIRTPLNHIQGFAELLLMDEKISSSHGDYIRAILAGSDALKAAMLAHIEYVEKITQDLN